jgi:uncharacterized metal-binding protein
LVAVFVSFFRLHCRFIRHRTLLSHIILIPIVIIAILVIFVYFCRVFLYAVLSAILILVILVRQVIFTVSACAIKISQVGQHSEYFHLVIHHLAQGISLQVD